MIVEPYHSALRPPVEFSESVSVEVALGSAFCWDFVEMGIPDHYAPADVFYVETPWAGGMKEFERRAGRQELRPYRMFTEALTRAITDVHPRPVIIVASRSIVKHLPKSDAVIQTILNGDRCVALCYRVKPHNPKCWRAGTCYILSELASRFDCVGDFCCGYGNTGKAFASAGKRFILSDMNPKCIGGCAEWLGALP